jgi:hypothetical protein
MLKKIILIVSFVSISFLMLPSVMADGFAAWIKANPNTIRGQMTVTEHAALKRTPTRQELGIPVYPNMKIFGYIAPGKTTRDIGTGKEKSPLAYFYLTSKSLPEQIVHFYRVRLTGKGYSEVKSGRATIFVQKSKKTRQAHESYQFEAMGVLFSDPHVSISTPMEHKRPVLPGEKTQVIIAYKPKKKL